MRPHSRIRFRTMRSCIIDMFRTPSESTRKVQWATPLRQYVGCSEDFIRRLLSLGPPEDVRIIVWFDY